MHQITYRKFTSRKTRAGIQADCDKEAKTYGDYHCRLEPIKFYEYPVCKNETEARAKIDEYDNGWYNQIAVKYKDGRKVMWLVKIEYHV